MLLQVLLITILTLVIFIAQQVILKKLSVKDAIKNTCQQVQSACLSCKGQFKQILSKYPKISQKFSVAKKYSIQIASRLCKYPIKALNFTAQKLKSPKFAPIKNIYIKFISLINTQREPIKIEAHIGNITEELRNELQTLKTDLVITNGHINLIVSGSKLFQTVQKLQKIVPKVQINILTEEESDKQEDQIENNEFELILNQKENQISDLQLKTAQAEKQAEDAQVQILKYKEEKELTNAEIKELQDKLSLLQILYDQLKAEKLAIEEQMNSEDVEDQFFIEQPSTNPNINNDNQKEQRIIIDLNQFGDEAGQKLIKQLQKHIPTIIKAEPENKNVIVTVKATDAEDAIYTIRTMKIQGTKLQCELLNNETIMVEESESSSVVIEVSDDEEV
ncbi:Hypothetical_protein [Hexamita inflata]|uniref:Hypothetical_protein n=1 Tax=Hexamita inflata TaxID=28002 RepID=A0AA86PYI3_9EUKA|nr:Hypothetical protein HINF_LOCUS36066 [Hexamita inflata]